MKKKFNGTNRVASEVNKLIYAALAIYDKEISAKNTARVEKETKATNSRRTVRHEIKSDR